MTITDNPIDLLAIRCPEGCDTFGTIAEHEIITTDDAGRIVVWHGRCFGPVVVNVLQTIGLPGYEIEAVHLDDSDFKSGRNADAGMQAVEQLVEDVTAAHAWMEKLISSAADESAR